jgi:hypothetical protein
MTMATHDTRKFKWLSRYFIGFALKGRDYGMVDTSFGPFDTLFKFHSNSI